ncbi:MAG TPA: hypothetical protein VF832_10605 [Longimicrobiales bacterium]
MEEQKKAYVTPTLTEYGKVEKETRGVAGSDWEVFGTRQASGSDNPTQPTGPGAA